MRPDDRMRRKPVRVRGMVSGKARLWLAVGLVGLAYALRVSGLTYQSLWRDEVDAIRFASRPLGDLLRMAVSPGQNGGLYFAGLRLWLGIAGHSEFALRFASVVASVLAVAVSFRFLRRVHPQGTALAAIGALLTATSPYLVWYGQDGKMYSALVLAALVSMERFAAALQRGGLGRWLAYAIVSAAACYVHLIAALLIPFQVGALLVHTIWRRAYRRSYLIWSLLLLLLLSLPLLRWELPMLFERAETGYPYVPLPEMVASLFGVFAVGVVQPATWWALMPTVILLGSALLVRWKVRWPGTIGFLAGWLVVPVISLYLITLVRPIYTARYLILVLPALLFLVARGATALRGYSRLLAGVGLAGLLAVNGYGLWLQARTPVKTDFRSATHYLAQHLERGDTVVFQIPHGRYSFEYYLDLEQEPGKAGDLDVCCRIYLPRVVGGGRPYRWADGLYTNAGMGIEEADRQMQKLVGGSRQVWLVASEVAMWDQRDLVRAWLDAHAASTDVADFVRVTVHRYEFP